MGATVTAQTTVTADDLVTGDQIFAIHEDAFAGAVHGTVVNVYPATEHAPAVVRVRRIGTSECESLRAGLFASVTRLAR